MNERKKKKKPRNKLYTKGELNYAVDGIIHPLFKTNKTFIVIDGLLHMMIEKNPGQSARKFLKYNRTTIIQEIRKLVD